MEKPLPSRNSILGCNVQVSSSPDNASSFRGLLDPAQMAELEASDLVIVHRATSSGSFVGEEGAIQARWNNLDVPLLLGSAYAIGDPSWELLDIIEGDGSRQSVSDPITGSQRYYRIVRP